MADFTHNGNYPMDKVLLTICLRKECVVETERRHDGTGSMHGAFKDFLIIVTI